jgi:hypothetical protein
MFPQLPPNHYYVDALRIPSQREPVRSARAQPNAANLAAPAPGTPAPGMSATLPATQADLRDLLDKLVASALGPLNRVQETVNFTLDEVTAWIARPVNRKRIARLITLLDAQTQLLVCQHRLLAVARLVEVAHKAESPETARRACANLLRIRLIDPYREDKRSPDADADAQIPVQMVVKEDDILSALRRLSDEDWAAGRDDDPTPGGFGENGEPRA